MRRTLSVKLVFVIPKLERLQSPLPANRKLQDNAQRFCGIAAGRQESALSRLIKYLLEKVTTIRPMQINRLQIK